MAIDSDVDGSASDFFSEASSYASEFEDVVEHEAISCVANTKDEIIPPCEGYSRDQWVDLDVILLNACVVPVVNNVCRNLNSTDCIEFDANPLGEEDVGVCILNSLLPSEVPPGWRFSLRR